jgi:hypothetical protein
MPLDRIIPVLSVVPVGETDFPLQNLFIHILVFITSVDCNSPYIFK